MTNNGYFIDETDQYFYWTRGTPLLSADEERRLAEQYTTGRAEASKDTPNLTLVEIGQAARERLIVSNLRLVIYIAKYHKGQGLSLSDLIQEGNLGLMRAIDKFDVTRGNRLSTYATSVIRKAVARAIENMARTIRIPVHVSEAAVKIRSAAGAFVRQHHRQATIDDIAAALDWPREQVITIMKARHIPLSLFLPIGTRQQHELFEIIPDRNAPNLNQEPITSDLQRDCHEALEAFDERTQQILKLHYGIGREAGMNLTDVGRQLGIDHKTARYHHDKATTALREGPAAEILHAYLTD